MFSFFLFSTVDIKPDVPLAVEPLSPLDLRTDLRMLGPGSDPGLWERQLQQELLLIQKQQQIQKQLLISEFQKQHEKLTRQHQAQLQEHLKVSVSLSSSSSNNNTAVYSPSLAHTVQVRRKHYSSGQSYTVKEKSQRSSMGREASHMLENSMSFVFHRTARTVL